MTILNIYGKSFISGLKTDMQIIKHIAQSANIKNVNCIEFKQPNKPCDVAVFLEHIQENLLSKKNIWIPNHEFISEYDEKCINRMDIILCKTHFCKKLIDRYCLKKNIKPTVIYSGFITINPLINEDDFWHELDTVTDNKADSEVDTVTDDKADSEVDTVIGSEAANDDHDELTDKTLFIHFAGTSHYKNTKLLLKHWSNSSLADNTSIQLIAALKTTSVNKFDPHNLDIKWEEKKMLINGQFVHGLAHKNIFFYNELFDKDTYQYLLKKAKFAICPSNSEGFGHYINISRFAGNYVITLDAPPMNELINESYGSLIKINKSDTTKNSYVFISKNFDEPVYTFKKENLEKTVIDVLDMTDKEIKDKSRVSLQILNKTNKSAYDKILDIFKTQNNKSVKGGDDGENTYYYGYQLYDQNNFDTTDTEQKCQKNNIYIFLCFLILDVVILAVITVLLFLIIYYTVFRYKRRTCVTLF